MKGEALDIESVEVDSTVYPVLSRVNSPKDLRALSMEELEQLCKDIRLFLINSLSTNPGHFASSMGSVELTVALHYVFDTPYDRIVWDVGHQAYGHKLLTGRAQLFHANRKFGGLSGFPNPDESEYDTFTAGHASNSISAALGMSVASLLKGETPKRNVVAVIGDASISGGLAFEGLNNAANARNNLLIVLNDNDMSIDHNVGALNSYLTNIHASRAYNKARYSLWKALRKVRVVSDKNRGRLLRFNNSLKSLLFHEQNIFEGLNIRYFGPFDGHDLARLIRVFNDIKDMEGPRLLHLRTVKGKGFDAAEQDPATWHAPGKFNPIDGNRLDEGDKPRPPKYQDVFGETLLELARTNDKIVGITAAMPSGTSMSILQREIPGRVFDVGISEGHAVTFAGGLAKDGMRPFVAIYSAFLQRAYDNIVHDVALPRLPVVFCIDRAGIVGEDGATHHGALDLSYMRDIPGMIVSAPRDERMLRNLLYTSQLPALDGPMAIRYPRGRCNSTEWQTPMQELPIGRAELLCDGTDVCILTIGTIASEAAKAITAATAEGISVCHYDMVFLKPLDIAPLEHAAAKGMPIITIEDASVNGGLGSAVAEWMADHGCTNRLRRLGIPDRFVPQGTVAQLYKYCGIDADSILEAIKKVKPDSTKP